MHAELFITMYTVKYTRIKSIAKINGSMHACYNTDFIRITESVIKDYYLKVAS